MIDVDLLPLFSDTVTIAKRTSTHTGPYPQPGYGSPTTYYAHIERSADMVKTDEGQEIVSKRKVYLFHQNWGTSNIPKVVDRITLPETHEPRQSPILMVQLVSDDQGLHHCVVWM